MRNFYFSKLLLIIRYGLIVISECHCMSHRYMSSRGGSHRATLPLVGLKDAQEAQRKMTPSRSRRSGLLTVTERPPGKRSWNAQWFDSVLVIRSHPKKKNDMIFVMFDVLDFVLYAMKGHIYIYGKNKKNISG